MDKFQKAAALFPAGTRVRAVRGLRTGVDNNETRLHIPAGAHGIVLDNTGDFIRVIFDTCHLINPNPGAKDGPPLDITSEHYDRRAAFRQVFNFRGAAYATKDGGTEPAKDHLATDDIEAIVDTSGHLTVVCEAIDGDGSLSLYSGPDTPEARKRIEELDGKHGGMFRIADGTPAITASAQELINTLDWWGNGCEDNNG